METVIEVRNQLCQKVLYNKKVNGYSTSYTTIHNFPEWMREGVEITHIDDLSFSLSPLDIDTPPDKEKKGSIQNNRIVLWKKIVKFMFLVITD